MTTFRTRKNKNNPYVQINKGFLDRNDLTWKAKGLLTYLLSRPDNWKTYISQLTSAGKDGQHSVLTAIKELESAGYLVRGCIRDEGGRIIEWYTDVYEIPQEKPDNDYPDLINPEEDYPDRENSDLDNRQLLNNDQLKNKLKKDIQTNADASVSLIKAKTQSVDPCVGASESPLSYDSTAKKNGSANPEISSLVKDPGFDEKKEIAPPTPPRKMPATQMLKGGMARKIHNEVVAIYLANKPDAWVGVPVGVPLGGLEKNEIAARIAEFEDEHGERGYEIFKDALAQVLQGMQRQDDFYRNNKSIGLHSVLHKLTQYAGLVNIQVGQSSESPATTPQNADPLARLSVEQNSVVFTALELATSHLDIRNHSELTQPQKLKMCRDRQAAQSRLRKHLAGIIGTLSEDVLSDAKALAVCLTSNESLAA